MKSHQLSFVLSVLVIAQLVNAQAQPWQLQVMDHGGVIPDIQLVVHNEPGAAQNQVWAACMNGGVFRSTWNNGWSSWNEYIPGKKAYGLDAIEITYSPTSSIEFVICGTGGLGVWYGYSVPPFSSFNFLRPNTFDNSWAHAFIHDAAFYWPGTGIPTSPSNQYYVILAGITSSAIINPGIYRWNGSFYRVDGINAQADAHNYSHFYRDIDPLKKNVLWVIRNTKKDAYDQIIENGGLFRLMGGYTAALSLDCGPAWQPEWGQITNDNFQEILGFSEWEVGSTNYYYVLLHRILSGDETYEVYVGTNLADLDEVDIDWGEPIYDCTDLFVNAREWEDVSHELGGSGVIGRPTPDASGSHQLWVTSAVYGVWFKQTNLQPAYGTQVNDGLQRWAVRAFVPDSSHIQWASGERMRFFFGTHQRGVWYLKFCPAE